MRIGIVLTTFAPIVLSPVKRHAFCRHVCLARSLLSPVVWLSFLH